MEDSLAQVGTVGNVAILVVTALTGGGGYRLFKTYLEYMKDMKGSANNEFLERISALERNVAEKEIVNETKDRQISELLTEISNLRVAVGRSNKMVQALTAAIKAEMTPEQSAKFLEAVDGVTNE